MSGSLAKNVFSPLAFTRGEYTRPSALRRGGVAGGGPAVPGWRASACEAAAQARCGQSYLMTSPGCLGLGRCTHVYLRDGTWPGLRRGVSPPATHDAADTRQPAHPASSGTDGNQAPRPPPLSDAGGGVGHLGNALARTGRGAGTRGAASPVPCAAQRVSVTHAPLPESGVPFPCSEWPRT